jgi:hypothetical protein
MCKPAVAYLWSTSSPIFTTLRVHNKDIISVRASNGMLVNSILHT